MLSGAVFYALNSPKIVCRPGSAQTRRGAHSAPPGPLTELRGALCGAEEGEGKERNGGMGKKKNCGYGPDTNDNITGAELCAVKTLMFRLLLRLS